MAVMEDDRDSSNSGIVLEDNSTHAATYYKILTMLVPLK